MDTANVIKLEGTDVLLAQVDGGSPNVYCNIPFVLSRPRWIPDDERQACCLCLQKFNKIRRKHHCRQCGRILCNKCCFQKVVLPHLEYLEPEKVCEECLPVSELVTKARSEIEDFQLFAAEEILKRCLSSKELFKLLQIGGVQTLVFLAAIARSEKVKGVVLRGLHSLCTQEPLLDMLAAAGGLHAICNIICELNASSEQALSDGVSALFIFCRSNRHLQESGLSSQVLKAIRHACTMKEHIAMMAVQSLVVLAKDCSIQTAIVQDNDGILSRLMGLLNCKDEQMVEMVLRLLAELSAKDERARDKIILEDSKQDQIIFRCVQRSSKLVPLYVSGAALVGNLLTTHKTQQYTSWLCELTRRFPANTDLMGHVMRALANSVSSRGVDLLVSFIPRALDITSKSGDVVTQSHCSRLVLALLNIAFNDTSNVLLSDRDSMSGFLRQLFLSNERVLRSVMEVLETAGATVASPQHQ